MDFSGFNTVDETARVLKTNRKTVYDAIARGEIPVVRIGRVIRVPGAWLKAAREAQPSPTKAA